MRIGYCDRIANALEKMTKDEKGECFKLMEEGDNILSRYAQSPKDKTFDNNTSETEKDFLDQLLENRNKMIALIDQVEKR